MKKFLFFIILSGWGIDASSQLATSAVQIGWNTLVPFSDKDYISNTGSSGLRFTYSRFAGEKFGYSLDVGYSVLDDYVPRATYEFPGGAITTDIFNYMYYFTVGVSGQYYFKSTGKLIPYVSMGIGAAATEYKIFYNVYEDGDSKTGFLARPEIGVLFRFSESRSFGLKGNIAYDYATNKSDYMGVNNFSALGIQVGVVFFTD